MIINRWVKGYKARRLNRIAHLESTIAQLEQECDRQRDENAMLRHLADDDYREQKHQLEDQLRGLRNQIAELEAKAKREDEELAHLVRMKESKLEWEAQQKALAMERQKIAQIDKIKSEYCAKLEKQLEERITEMRAMYTEILARLPDINVQLRGKV